MQMITFGPVGLNPEEMKTEISEKFSKCKEEPKIAFIYVPIGSDIKRIVKLIKSIVNIPVVGATTGGASFTERGIGMNSLSGGFLCGEDLFTQQVRLNFSDGSLTEIIDAAVKKITPAKTPGHTLFAFADAMSCDGELFIKELSKKVPVHWRIIGGFAGDNWEFKNTKVILDEDAFEGGAVLAYINCGVAPLVNVRHGFEPVPDLKEMVITSNDGNIVHTIDNKPAVEAYREELEKHNVIDKKADILATFAKYPLGIKMLTGERLKIRTPMGNNGTSIVLAGSLSKGDRVRIMYGTNDSMIKAVKDMTGETVKSLNGVEPKCQFVIDCAGRRMILGDDYKNQIKALRISPTCPMLGFASYGEFARYGGSMEGFHNTTDVIAIW